MPRVGSEFPEARPGVSVPTRGREFPGWGSPGWRESPVTPEGGGARGNRVNHISPCRDKPGPPLRRPVRRLF